MSHYHVYLAPLTVTRTRRTPISVELYGETVVIGYRESTRTVPATKPRSFTTSAKWRAESKARANQLAREARPDPAFRFVRKCDDAGDRCPAPEPRDWYENRWG